MKRSATLTAGLVVCTMCFLPPEAFGQLGTTGNTGRGNQQSSFGAQSPLGSQGQSAFGQLGQQGGGQLGTQGANRNQRQVGGQDGFVGTDANQVRNQQLSGRQQRRALFDLAVESLNEMRDSRRERNARRNAPAPVRVRLRPLFSVSAPNPTVVTTRVQANLDRSLSATAASTQVTVEGGSATLTGSVTSDYESKLAAKMVSLTPGVYEVNNQLAIESSTPTTSQPTNP